MFALFKTLEALANPIQGGKCGKRVIRDGGGRFVAHWSVTAVSAVTDQWAKWLAAGQTRLENEIILIGYLDQT